MFRTLVAAAAGVSMSLASMAQTSSTPPGPNVTALFSKEMPDIAGKEGLMLFVEYPPGAVEHSHRHDAHAFVYVIEGSIVMGLKGAKEVTLRAGQTFYEGPNDIHTVGRNASATQPAKFVVVLVKQKGVEAVLPLK